MPVDPATGPNPLGPRVLALTHVFPRTAEDPSAPFLLTWAHALRDTGVDIGVLAPHDAGLRGRYDVAGIPVRAARYAPSGWERVAYRGEMHQLVRRPHGPPLVGSLIANLARALRQEVRRGQPDLVHVHWWVPGAIVARLAGTGVPTVLTLHGTDVALLEARPALIKLARWALAGIDRVEAVSGHLADRFRDATGRKVDAVNPMPLGPDCFTATAAPVPPDEFTVLAAGRMVPEKGFADLIEAVAGLPEAGRLILVGDGPERERLRALATALNVRLDLPGRMSPLQLQAAYRRVSVVAQPSHREGFGLVAAEAACAGVPVVATDSGGARDLLDRAHLVPVGDIDQLRAALTAVAADPSGARKTSAVIATRARDRLSPAAAAARTLGLYGSVDSRLARHAE